MRQLLILLIVCGFNTSLFAQRIHIQPFAGMANYQGDVQQKIFTFQKAKASYGVSAAYEINDHIDAAIAFTQMSLYGDDKTTGLPRNVNFRTNLSEIRLSGEYNLLSLENWNFTPFLTAGVAGFKYNPYTYDAAGKQVYLQPLGTEGQGLPQYSQKKMYSLTQMSIPLGGGFKYAINENFKLHLEFIFRKLMTDYLDDVSGNYADATILGAARGPVAVAMAYRGNEIGHNTYPIAGEQRGNPKANDWYYTAGLKLSFRLGAGGGGGGYYGGRSGRKTGCPSAF